MEKILSRFVEPSKSTLTDTCDSINFGKEKVFILTEMATIKRELGSVVAAGGHEVLSVFIEKGSALVGRWRENLKRHQRIGKQK